MGELADKGFRSVSGRGCLGKMEGRVGVEQDEA
jgi:hypothetical protein